MILALTCAEPLKIREPKLLLENYTALDGCVEYRDAVPDNVHCRTLQDSWHGISLASSTKSWLKTHYAGIRFPVRLEEVLKPNGLQLKYYDVRSQSWLGQRPLQLTFAHHMKLALPAPYSSLPCLSQPVSAPVTINDIVASQSRLPPGLSTHECLSYQSLLNGEKRRWPDLLSELGASNLNFSAEGVNILIARTVLEVGPAGVATSFSDPLRSAHHVFRDSMFCLRLVEQISSRLNVISTNWREYRCMDMLLNLTLTVHTLSKESEAQAVKLLHQARVITYNWTTQLRASISQATTLKARRNLSLYAFPAALLCRRTFAVEHEKYLQPFALSVFLESALVLQANINSDPSKLPPFSLKLLIRDLKSMHRLRSVIDRSLQMHPNAMLAVAKYVWPQVPMSAVSTTFAPGNLWVQSLITSNDDYNVSQAVVHFHFLLGYLYVNGKPVGKLAPEQEKSVVNDLFGDEQLDLFPSVLPGMTHRVGFPREGNEVHLGYRHDNTMYARAKFRGRTYQFIPNNVFYGDQSWICPRPWSRIAFTGWTWSQVSLKFGREVRCGRAKGATGVWTCALAPSRTAIVGC